SIGGDSAYGDYFQGRIDDVRIYNRALSDAEIQTDMNTAAGEAPAPDTEAPTVTITSPTGGTTYSTSTSPLTLAGTAADNLGVTQVTWSNDRGSNGTASGTTSWSASGIVLQSGANVLTVSARDAAGNVGIDTLTVTYTPPAPDTTPPTSPATLGATPTAAQITLSWSAASDNVAVTGYAIERCQGGGCSSFAQIGTTTGATTYSNTGLNAGTSYSYRVRATDAAGNFSGYSPTASATTPALAGPVAVYAFNEGTGTTLTDLSGNANTGAIAGGATWTSSGKNGGALQFDGVDDRVTIASSASLNATTAVTLEAWVYPTANQSGWRNIVQHEVDAYFLYAGSSQGTLRPAGGATVGGTIDGVIASSSLPLNTWTHLALTFNGSIYRFYVNGTQIGTKSRTGTMPSNSNSTSIGGDSAYGDYFQGRIDDVRIYNRALSDAEIQTDMNTAAGP
ncbi:MAG TPA: LamG-like jellyroll fold domain-containing protein, partial [Steroidobacteraceae bacterium]